MLDRLSRIGGFAPLPIRIFLAVFLVYMAHDNVFSSARMVEFERFLDSNGFPAAAIAARVSVYAQFFGGILIGIGAFTRYAALVIAVNFVVAIVGVHLALPFRTYLEPCAMLAAALALVLGGAGWLSVDAALDARRARRASGSKVTAA
ncbi:MAG TPA: DoxX family protein [Kofleriaceae bacterium]|nr:DoxX family protein [Kofleriaceae bacterium]